MNREEIIAKMTKTSRYKLREIDKLSEFEFVNRASNKKDILIIHKKTNQTVAFGVVDYIGQHRPNGELKMYIQRIQVHLSPKLGDKNRKMCYTCDKRTNFIFTGEDINTWKCEICGRVK